MAAVPRNLLAVYAAHGLNGVVAILTVPITVKLLGISGYGLFSVYAVLVSYILLADFGVSKNLLRLLAKTGVSEAGQRHIRVALGLYVLLCGVWFVACPLLAVAVPRYVFPVPAEAVATLRWMVLFCILEFTLGVPASVLQTACVAGQRFPRYVRFSLASGLIRSAAILAGAFFFRSPLAIAAMLAARKIIEFPIASRLLGKLPAGAWRPIFDRTSFRTMLGESATLSAAQVTYSTALSIGSPLVNAAFGLHGLGLYRAAFDLAGKIAFVSNGITLIVFPKAAQRFSTQSPEGNAPLYSRMLFSSVTFYGCFAGVAVLLAPAVLPAIGLSDPTTIRLFVVLIVALSLNAHSLLSNELIHASGRYRDSVAFGLSLLGTLTLLFELGQRAGIMAIGWAWLGAAVVGAFVADGLLLKASRSGAARQLGALAVTIAAAAAASGLAFVRLGLAAPPVGAVCGFVLAALLGLAIRDAVPLIRIWREESPVAAASA
jgi:O-antigen/teichoic acid export membrane protein